MPIENDYMRTVRLERKFFPKILFGLNRQVLSYIETSVVDPTALTEAITELYLYTVRVEGKRTQRLLKSREKKDLWLQDVLEFLEYFLMRLSVNPVTVVTRGKIQEILQKSVQEGWSEETTVKELYSLLNDKVRALKIVRTETIRAVNLASMMAAHDSDFLYEKKWMAIDDARTRRTHRHGSGVDGEIRDLYEEFSNGLMFPGDPLGPPREVINCRCRLGFSLKRENGKPIRKQPTQTLPRILYLHGLEKGLEQLLYETLQR